MATSAKVVIVTLTCCEGVGSRLLSGPLQWSKNRKERIALETELKTLMVSHLYSCVSPLCIYPLTSGAEQSSIGQSHLQCLCQTVQGQLRHRMCIIRCCVRVFISLVQQSREIRGQCSQGLYLQQCQATK